MELNLENFTFWFSTDKKKRLVGQIHAVSDEYRLRRRTFHKPFSRTSNNSPIVLGTVYESLLDGVEQFKH